LKDIDYIKKIEVNSNEKIIIFGDFHGSYHTFFRHMSRLHLLGVLDFDKFKINEGYRLIFLGDIVDRGEYSIEILEILFKFMINDDNDRLLINRGNHEEIETNERYGLEKEVNKKFDNPHIFGSINAIFTFLPTGVIINHKEDSFWLCHGFIPNDPHLKILENIKNNKDINIKIESSISKQIKWNDPNW